MTRHWSALLSLLLLTAACGGGGPDAACTGQEVDLRSEGTLTVGTDLSSPPFAFREGGQVAGFEVDLFRAVAEHMGLELDLVERGTSGLVPGLVAEHFDVVASGVEATEDVRSQACVTEPYAPTGVAVVVDATRTPEADDLPGPVAALAGSRAAGWAAERWDEVHTHPTPEDVVLTLENGGVEGIVLPLAEAWWRVERRPGLRIVEEEERGPGYVALVSPDDRGLIGAVSDALSALRDDGTYAEIHERWFGRPPG